MINVASVGPCRLCGQGRLVISRDDSSHELFVCCEECETEWASPDATRSLEHATRDVHGRSTPLAREDLVGHPWHAFLW
ncbi:MAG: hypothetical protein K8W52_41725 [Deltaproteobacteria bacterium]|nr:hypothetical protein [Deltaproteobacteria bacterium]